MSDEANVDHEDYKARKHLAGSRMLRHATVRGFAQR